MSLPYARFSQAARLAGEAAGERARAELRVAAFIGWQVRSAVSMGGKQPDFRKYLKQLGLHEESRVTRAQLEKEKAAAASIGERVREAFKGGVRKADI